MKKDKNICKICNKEFKKSPSFVYHIIKKHNISKNEYIKKFPISLCDFEYNRILDEKTKTKISRTKRERYKNGDYKNSYNTNKCKQARLKGSIAFQDKLRNMNYEEKKKILFNFTKAGSLATQKKWKNININDKEIILNKIFYNRKRQKEIQVKCINCNKKIFRKIYIKNIDEICNHQSKIYFCSKKCQGNYYINKPFFGKGKYEYILFDKKLYLRSKYEVEFLNILKNTYKKFTVDYETIQIKYIFEKKEKVYVVDFKININDLIFLIEIGSRQLKYLNEHTSKIFEEKTNALISFCKQNNYKYLFLNEKNLFLGDNKKTIEEKSSCLKKIMNS